MFATPVQKQRFREKVLDCYDTLFELDGGIEKCDFNFLLLKVNEEGIRNKLCGLSKKDLRAIKANIRELLAHCLKALLSDNNTIVLHALQTIHSILWSIFTYKYSSFVSEVFDIICGSEHADHFFEALLRRTEHIILGDYHDDVKLSGLKLFFVLSSASHNIHQNVFVDYFWQNDVFKCLIQFLKDDRVVGLLPYAVMVILSLCHYQQYDGQNSCIDFFKRAKASTIHSFNKSIQKLSTLCKREYELHLGIKDSNVSSYLFQVACEVSSYLPSWVYSSDEMKTGDGSDTDRRWCFTILSLLPLYHLIHLNSKYFVYTAKIKRVPDEQLRKNPKVVISPTICPDVLCDFFTLMSCVIKEQLKSKYIVLTRLCLIMCRMQSEDPACSIVLHDTSCEASCYICVRDKSATFWKKTSKDTPLVAVCFTLLNGFMMTHVHHLLHLSDVVIDLFRLCLDTLYRHFCFERQAGIKELFMETEYLQLTKVVLRMCSIVASGETDVWSPGVMAIVLQGVNFVRVVISFCQDIFVSDGSINSLWYEMALNSDALAKLQLKAQYLEQYQKLYESLGPVCEVAKHFASKVHEFCDMTRLSSPLSVEQVLNIVDASKNNLSLPRLQLNGKYMKYAESPRENLYFNHLINTLVHEFELLYLNK